MILTSKVNNEDFDSKKTKILFNEFLEYLKERKISLNDLSKEEQIPIAIFDNDILSALESIAKYLKENRGLTFHQIAVLLKRDDRTIWSSYNKASKKRKNAR